MNKKYINLNHLFPKNKLKSTEWFHEWLIYDTDQFRKNSMWVFSIAALAYIFHYYFVDLPQNKTPINLWFNYRYSIAILSLICAFFPFFINKNKYYSLLRIPAFIGFFIGNYFQGQTMLWWAGTPFFFSFVLPLVGALTLRLNLINSILIYSLYWSAVKIS